MENTNYHNQRITNNNQQTIYYPVRLDRILTSMYIVCSTPLRIEHDHKRASVQYCKETNFNI